MPMLYSEDTAVATEVVSVEEAETLLAWLQATAEARIDLAACTHMHAAAVQVLMAARPVVTSWPANDGLAAWLMSALQDGGHTQTLER